MRQAEVTRACAGGATVASESPHGHSPGEGEIDSCVNGCSSILARIRRGKPHAARLSCRCTSGGRGFPCGRRAGCRSGEPIAIGGPLGWKQPDPLLSGDTAPLLAQSEGPSCRKPPCPYAGPGSPRCQPHRARGQSALDAVGLDGGSGIARRAGPASVDHAAPALEGSRQCGGAPGTHPDRRVAWPHLDDGPMSQGRGGNNRPRRRNARRRRSLKPAHAQESRRQTAPVTGGCCVSQGRCELQDGD